jgi:hypothetical protein
MLATRSSSSPTRIAPLADHHQSSLPPPPSAFPADALQSLRAAAADDDTSILAPALVEVGEDRSVHPTVEESQQVQTGESTIPHPTIDQRNYLHWESLDCSPPDYLDDFPPQYDHQHALHLSRETSSTSDEDEKVGLYDSQGESSSTPISLTGEKRQLELDALTDAVDRAYEATQLNDQRSDPPARKAVRKKSWSLVREGGKGKQKDVDVDVAEEKEREKELGEIWNHIERAHGNSESSYDYVDVTRDGS